MACSPRVFLLSNSLFSSLSGGCPGAPEPICSFCSVNNQSPAHANALLPPFYNQTCQDLQDIAPFFLTTETCSALTGDLPVYAEYYCGCMDMDPNFTGAQCNLCGVNETILYPDWTVSVTATKEMTCAEVGRMATTATDAAFCDSLVADFYSTCCLGIRPTAPPTGTPVSKPSLSPDSSTPNPAASATVSGTPTWIMIAVVSWWLCRRR